MKILVSLLVLLFLSGAFGDSTEQHDVNTHPRPATRESMKRLLYHTMVYGAETLSPNNEAALERKHLMLTSYFSVAIGIAENLVNLTEEVIKEIEENYPVFYKNVIPIFQSFIDQVVGNISGAREEITPYAKMFQAHVRQPMNDFWQDVHPIIQNLTKSTIEYLNVNAKPYRKSVRKEVAAAKTKEDSRPPSEGNVLKAIHIDWSLQKSIPLDKDQIKSLIVQLQTFMFIGY